MDSEEKKKIHNEKLRNRYLNDLEYREKKKQIAIQHYHNKKYSFNNIDIQIKKEPVTLYF